jgi:phage tail tape-measure protein
VAQVSEGLSKAAKGFAATGPGSAALKVAAPALTAAKGVSKFLGALATPLTVGFAAVESVQALSDNTLSATQKGERVGEATGGAIGSIAGLALSALAGPLAPLVAVPAVLAGNFIGEQIGGVFGEFIGGALEDEERQARQPAPVQVINPPEANSSRFLGTVRLVLGFDRDGLLKLIREQQNVDELGFEIEPDLGFPSIGED